MSVKTDETLPDIQNTPDVRGIDIDQVGVSNLSYPIVVLDRENSEQHTTASISLSVSLPHHFKGTHMSRFIEVLNRHRGNLAIGTVPLILEELKTELDAESSRMEVRFPYFIERSAPVSGSKALMDYGCAFIGEADQTSTDFILQVEVPVASLCPCSKEISDYGAHNQRGVISIETRSVRDEHGPKMIWIEELVEIAESSASAPLYPLLKRPDERHVTMQAFDNPMFVEDMVRAAAQALKNDERVDWFRVKARNNESIHNHDAFAIVSWKRDAE